MELRAPTAPPVDGAINQSAHEAEPTPGRIGPRPVFVARPMDGPLGMIYGRPNGRGSLQLRPLRPGRLATAAHGEQCEKSSGGQSPRPAQWRRMKSSIVSRESAARR